MLNRRSFNSSLVTAGIAALGIDKAFADQKPITYIGWSHEEAAGKPVFGPMFEAYRQANTDAKLETIGYPWGQIPQNVLLRLRSGQSLDVVQLAERWLPQFASTGKTVNLNDVFGKDVLEKAIPTNALKLGNYKGKQAGLPWTSGSIGMVANLKVMADAGVATPPKTIDAFVDALRAIKKANPQSVPYAMTTKNNNSMCPDFQVWLWTFGGEIFDGSGQVAVNSPAAVKALTFMTDLVKDGLAAKDVDRPDARRMFASNQTAFYQDAPLARGFARSNSGKGTEIDQFIAPVPMPVVKAGDVPRALAWGYVLSIFGDGKTAIDANSPQAKLLKHLVLNDENQLKVYKELGLFPASASALGQISHDAYVQKWMLASRSAEREEISQWTTSSDPITIVGEEVQSALLGQKTPLVAIQTMAKRLEAKMAELNKA